MIYPSPRFILYLNFHKLSLNAYTIINAETIHKIWMSYLYTIQ